MTNNITFTHVNNDTNGNPRYVVHFLALDVHTADTEYPLFARKINAVALAKTIGGREYRAKHYGGGIVFVSYNLQDLLHHINRVTGKGYTGYIID